MIVVDSSVLAAFIRKEPGWERLVDYVKNSVSMDLAVKEVSNAIWKDYAVRKLIDYETALALFKIMS
ncbi:twitching motility protein PilT, partial [Candidatus Bathyarchaeota archaeon]|nr:twitching motility protein PilT [Candidatus Bathyarchaeota archaeon]